MLAPFKPKQKQVSGKDVAHNFKNRYIDESELQKPDLQTARMNNIQTQEQFSSLANTKVANVNKKYDHQAKQDSAQYIRYTPNSGGVMSNSNAKQRIIKMHTVQEDPMNPGGFKHKKIAKGPGSPPKAIMHSPTRKVTGQDMLDWKVPPCVSNWKNAKGYTIPLEMRLKADGRTLQQHTVSENHSKLANSLYITERISRKELNERHTIQKTLAQKDHIKQEQEMRNEAKKAREDKKKLMEEQEVDQENLLKKRSDPVQREIEQMEDIKNQQIDQLIYINKRETEREARLAAAGAKKTKQVRDQERDISEKVALGQAQANTGKREVQFDSRLFNQTGGLDSGFGDDDENRLYDKPLFNDRTAASIYKNVRQDDQDDGRTSKGIERILQAQKRGFEGGSENAGGSRQRPVEFVKTSDPSFQNIKNETFESDVVQKKQKQN